MIKVVLNANILVSALLIPRSNPAKILDLIREGELQPFMSFNVLSEIRSVLRYPKLKKRHHQSHKQIDQFLENLFGFAAVTPGKLKVEAVKDDPEDNKYLVCAVEGEVDFIISGDHHLIDLKSFRGIRIVDPATFLAIIKSEGILINKNE